MEILQENRPCRLFQASAPQSEPVPATFANTSPGQHTAPLRNKRLFAVSLRNKYWRPAPLRNRTPAHRTATKQTPAHRITTKQTPTHPLRLTPLRLRQNKTDKPILSKSCPLIPYYFLFVKLFLQQNNHHPKIIVPIVHSTPAPTPHSMLIFYPLPSPLWLKHRL